MVKIDKEVSIEEVTNYRPGTRNLIMSSLESEIEKHENLFRQHGWQCKTIRDPKSPTDYEQLATIVNDDDAEDTIYLVLVNDDAHASRMRDISTQMYEYLEKFDSVNHWHIFHEDVRVPPGNETVKLHGEYTEAYQPPPLNKKTYEKPEFRIVNENDEACRNRHKRIMNKFKNRGNSNGFGADMRF